MTLQEARQRVAEKYGFESWKQVGDNDFTNQYFTEGAVGEAIELYRAHWESVGVKKGMEQALEVVKKQVTYWPGSFYMEEENDATWIAGDTLQEELQAAIEQLQVTKQQS